MPTTRRSASSNLARSGPAKGQSTISFSNKVTKSVPRAQQNKGIAAPSVAKAEPIEKPSPAPPSEVHVVDEPKAELAENHEPQAERQAQEPVKSEAQVQAGKLSEADISKYWRDIESRRVAPRVHQDDLSLSEKILRYFDVSSQYGVSFVQILDSMHVCVLLETD